MSTCAKQISNTVIDLDTNLNKEVLHPFDDAFQQQMNMPVCQSHITLNTDLPALNSCFREMRLSNSEMDLTIFKKMNINQN